MISHPGSDFATVLVVIVQLYDNTKLYFCQYVFQKRYDSMMKFARTSPFAGRAIGASVAPAARRFRALRARAFLMKFLRTSFLCWPRHRRVRRARGAAFPRPAGAGFLDEVCADFIPFAGSTPAGMMKRGRNRKVNRRFPFLLLPTRFSQKSVFFTSPSTLTPPSGGLTPTPIRLCENY